MREILNSVVKWSQEHNIREIMVLDGMASDEVPAERKPIIVSSDGKSDDHAFLSRIRNETPSKNQPAFISGISGGLLASCISNGIPCTGILIPASPGVPDPEGSAILIETANKLANNSFNIDVRQLRSEAIELKNQMQQLVGAVLKQQQDASIVGSGMYG